MTTSKPTFDYDDVQITVPALIDFIGRWDGDDSNFPYCGTSGWYERYGVRMRPHARRAQLPIDPAGYGPDRIAQSVAGDLLRVASEAAARRDHGPTASAWCYGAGWTQDRFRTVTSEHFEVSVLVPAEGMSSWQVEKRRWVVTPEEKQAYRAWLISMATEVAAGIAASN